ncbi:MAG: hypothetical protein ACJAVI_004610 [Candidatus Azotimanducaceae bacterium]|jgi:hypothetical protein
MLRLQALEAMVQTRRHVNVEIEGAGEVEHGEQNSV